MAAPAAAQKAKSAVRFNEFDVSDVVVEEDELPSGPDDWGPSLSLSLVADCGVGVGVDGPSELEG